jgi:hypothetical protein
MSQPIGNTDDDKRGRTLKRREHDGRTYVLSDVEREVLADAIVALISTTGVDSAEQRDAVRFLRSLAHETDTRLVITLVNV